MKIANKKSLTPIKKNGPFSPDTFQKLANPHIPASFLENNHNQDGVNDSDDEDDLGRHLQNKISIITSPVLRSKRLSAKKSGGRSTTPMQTKKPSQQELLINDNEVIDLANAFESLIVQDKEKGDQEDSKKAALKNRKATPFHKKVVKSSCVIPRTPTRSSSNTLGFADLTDDGDHDNDYVLVDNKHVAFVKQEDDDAQRDLGLCDVRDDDGNKVRRSCRNNKRTSV